MNLILTLNARHDEPRPGVLEINLDRHQPFFLQMRSLSVLAVLLLLSGCELISTVESDRPLRITMVNSDGFDVGTVDRTPFVLIGAVIEGGALRLDVTHRSGCVSREYTLYSTEGIYFSDPPQALMYLSLEASDDDCPEVMTESLRFDLAPLRSYEKIYLRIHGYGMTHPFQPIPLFEP